ncbi:hypothetical protein B5P44_17600 [Mycobacterium sp. CBMA 213]|nr:hypothetical protein [Mycolicibacterium sp. CBMA 213]
MTIREISRAGNPFRVSGQTLPATLVEMLRGQVQARPDVAAVLEHGRARIADFKLPQYVSVSTVPLPRNAGGKLLKGQLRDSVPWGAPVR